MLGVHQLKCQPTSLHLRDRQQEVAVHRDLRGPEHWKQVVESARMFGSMMQEALQDWAIHVTTKRNAAKGFVVESRL